MNAVNSYVRRHRSESEFATLMAMRLSSDGRVMRMVDAGHAMGAIVRAGAAATLLQCNGGPPVGVIGDSYEFSEIQLQPSDRILLFSDGVCEQRNADGEELGMQRILDCVANSPDERGDVECVMKLLRAHAAGAPFADDVSVASVAFEIPQEQSRA
jgi:serine phosphatase RsbU (regulator of sigma subunit)